MGEERGEEGKKERGGQIAEMAFEGSAITLSPSALRRSLGKEKEKDGEKKKKKKKGEEKERDEKGMKWKRSDFDDEHMFDILNSEYRNQKRTEKRRKREKGKEVWPGGPFSV